jgi:hypothetical protein
VAEQTISSPAEVSQAIEALSDADALRLMKAAGAHLKKVGHLKLGRSPEDLIQEAITRTLSGERSWKRGISFVFHLDQAMRSICSSWRKSASRAEQDGGGEIPSSARLGLMDEGDAVLEQAPSREADLEDELRAKQEVDRITRQFANDKIASEVLEGWKMELDGPGIQELGGISEKEYRAAVRRIRRSVV